MRVNETKELTPNSKPEMHTLYIYIAAVEQLTLATVRGKYHWTGCPRWATTHRVDRHTRCGRAVRLTRQNVTVKSARPERIRPAVLRWSNFLRFRNFERRYPFRKDSPIARKIDQRYVKRSLIISSSAKLVSNGFKFALNRLEMILLMTDTTLIILEAEVF